MKDGALMIRSILLGLAILVAIGTANASPIERACLKADRDAASRSLCNCIQQVADQTLSDGDQKLAATFFKDPHRAQEIRQSDSRVHERFWDRYKGFNETARSYCSASS